MANKSFRYFLKGIELRGETTDPSDNLSGSIWSNSTSGRFKGYIQAAIREFVTTDQTQTLSNKTIDAGVNTIQNLTTANLAAGVLVTDISPGFGTDDTIPSAKSVKTYVDAVALTHDQASEISYSNTTSGLTATNVQTAIDEVEGRVDLADNHRGSNAGVHGVTGSVVGTSDTQTLTSKTIDADLNTITNIENADIKVGAAIDAAKIANGTISNTEFQQLNGIGSAVVGVSDTQTLTNKTITGADIQTPVRSDVKQGTKSALTTYATTATNGQFVFATDTKEYLAVKDGVLVEVGSGAGGVGSVDTLMSQTFDKAVLGDFTQTGLELVSSPFIQGAFTARLIHQAASTYSFKQVVSVNPKFRGQLNTLAFSARSSALSANVTVTVTDETNATVLTSSTFTTGQITAAVFNTASSTTVTVTDRTILNQILAGATITGSGIQTGTTVSSVNSAASTITISQAATATATGVSLKVSVLPKTQKYSFAVPASCASLSYTITALAESGLPETYVDDVQIYLSQSANSSYSLTQTTFNATDWAPYTPTFTGFGTPSAVEFEWRQVGANYEIRGKFTTGTTTATEARISLPNGATSAGTAIIPSISMIGTGGRISATVAGEWAILIEPSVTYLTIGRSDAAGGALVKQTGSNAFNAGETFSFFASVPIAGLTANTTTTNTIPLTSSVLVTQPDYNFKSNSFNGTGSTNTGVIRATNILPSVGDFFTFVTDSVNGDRWIANKSGVVNFSASFDMSGSTATIIYFTKNATILTATPASSHANGVVVSNVGYASSTFDVASCTGSAIFEVGDILRLQTSLAAGVATNSNNLDWIQISAIGSTKILNPSSDQKIQIPTHQLRFEGASARGSTDTLVVKFDTQTITSGDAFTVTNTAANGTVITMKKSGKLSASVCLRNTSTAMDIYLSKNQQVLTAGPALSEKFGHSSVTTVTDATVTGYTDVVVGDVIRVITGANPTASTTGFFTLSLQETSVAVALQNVTPTYDNSDSVIRLDTANGWGSVSTRIRRFSNTIQNFGTDVTYTDSATLGSSFTINKDGEYMITYTDEFTASDYMGISLNSASLATNIQSITTSEVLAMTVTAAANNPNTVSWQGYLTKGDVVRPHTSSSGTGTTPARTKFTISRVGKTSGTVDVTPFVQIPQNDTQSSELIQTATFGLTTITGALTKNTNSGIYFYNSTSGIYTMLKKGSVSVSFTGVSSASSAAPTIYRKGVGISQTLTIATAGATATTSANFELEAGETFEFRNDSSNTLSAQRIFVTATAISNNIVSQTQTVSSDTMSFVFKSTAIDPNTDAIGTFNTYTYAANTNTATIATTAPTQTTSSMNVNGIQVFGRAYNAASNAASPAKVEIFIGKGLKSKQVDTYGALAKISPVITDRAYTGNTNEEVGVNTTYSETTGILTIDAGYAFSGTNVARTIDTTRTYSSGYFVFNASKSPSLVTVPQLQQRIAYLSDVKASGTSAGASTAAATQTRTLNTIVDSTGIVSSLNSNQFTLPAGTYRIDASCPAYYVIRHRARIRNITDGTTALLGTSEYALSNGTGNNDAPQTRSFISGEIVITSSKTFELQHYTQTSISNGLGVALSSGENEVYATVTITKIK